MHTFFVPLLVSLVLSFFISTVPNAQADTRSDKEFPILHKYGGKGLYWLKKVDTKTHRELITDIRLISDMCLEAEALKNGERLEELEILKKQIFTQLKSKKIEINEAVEDEKYHFILGIIVGGDSDLFVIELNREFDRAAHAVRRDDYPVVIEALSPYLK